MEWGVNVFLSVSNITKSYHNGITTQVLKGVNMELQKGHIGVILGPSGSGKSTLMNIIGGVDRADGGMVKVDDLQINWSNTGETAWVLFFNSTISYQILPWLRTLKWYQTSVKNLSRLMRCFLP